MVNGIESGKDKKEGDGEMTDRKISEKGGAESGKLKKKEIRKWEG